MSSIGDISQNAKTVLDAVNRLYRDSDIKQKDKASKWLGDFQRSVFAWETADELLRLKHDVESTYFAAQTIRTKILYSFHELPAHTHESLKDSLLNHIEQLCTMSPILTTQLSLAVCDMALQMPSWKLPAVTFMKKYSQENTHLPYLLELLTVLPEEVNNRTLRLGANRRADIIESMENTAPMVIDLLHSCVENVNDEQLLSKIFKCLGSWFYLGVLPGNHVARSKLLEPAFKVLRDITVPSTLYESACDCICAALYIVEDLARYGELVQLLFEGTHSLRDAYHNAVAHEDTDKCLNLCRVFTELAESLTEMIVNAPGAGMGDLITLDLLLLCNGHCQYEVAEITFNFWYRLSEMLYAADRTQITRVFGPYVERLIYSLVRHCQMEPDNDKILDKNDDFSDFRTRAADLVCEVVYLVGSTACFVHLFSLLSNNESMTTWDVTEATLFVMSAIAKNVDSSEEVTVPQVLHAIFNLPADSHIAVYHTSVQLIGELSPWIGKHPQLLDPALQFLTTALQRQELSSTGATSLQYLCETCGEQMAQHHASLVQLMQVADELNVSTEASLGLLKGVVIVLSKLPIENFKEAVTQLCTVQVNALAQQLNNQTTEKTEKGSTKDPTKWLDRLAAIFRNIDGKKFSQNGTSHPCKDVIEQMWPVLKAVVEQHKRDNRIVERWCRSIRFAVRSGGKSIQESLLNPIAETITSTFSIEPHSCFLYLGSVLMDEFGQDSTFSIMLSAFVQPTFALLNQDRGLHNHPDTVDDFFRLCGRFVENACGEFLTHSAFPAVMQCALAGLLLDHREANAAVTKFLRTIIECRDSKMHGDGVVVDEVISRFGNEIVQQSLQACLFHVPTFMYPDIAELWWAILSRNREAFSKWFMSALKNLPSETSLASATPDQVIQFHNEVIAADEWKTVSYHLRDFCRLYR